MNQIFEIFLLILYLFSFIVGFSSLLYSFIYYIIERVSWLKYYIIFLFLFGILLFIRALKLFSFLTIASFMYSDVFNTLYYFSFSISMSILLYVIPAFLYRFLNLCWNVKHIIAYLLLSVLFFILSIVGILIEFNFYIISNAIFYLFIIYLFILTTVNYKNIQDNTIKIVVKFLAIATLIIYPVLIYQLILFRNRIFDIGAMDITLLVFYIWWNLIMLGFLVWYFVSLIKSRDNFSSNDTTLKQKDTVNLTKREKEILSYLLSGKTNKEIALILDISLNTVNNHVANIYDKSDVKNRVELVHKFTK